MKNTFMKIVSLAVIAMLMLALAGCSDQPVDNVTPPDNQSDNAAVDSDNASPADSLTDEAGDIILTAELYNDAPLDPMGESPAEYYDGHYMYYVPDGETAKTIKIGDGYAVRNDLLPDQEVIAVLSDKEVLAADYPGNQIFRSSIEDDSAQPLLPEAEYGFTIEEYVAISGKWETIVWYDVPVVNKSGSHIAYWSNKFAADGSPVYEPGIWVYDLKTGEQTRIASPNGEDICVTPVDWIDDTHILFEAMDTYYSYDIAAQTAAEIVTLPDIAVSEKENILAYNGEKGLTVHNVKTGKKYIIQADNPGIPTQVSVLEDIAVFFDNSKDDIYILDMAKGSAKYIHAPFGDLKPGIRGFTPDGKLVIDAYNMETMETHQCYSVEIG